MRGSSRRRSKRLPLTLALSPRRAGRGNAPTRSRRSFERTQVWIFDLDNTLYPAECNLFAQVDRRMGEFIARYLGVPFEYARHLQKTYYRQFGTTLSGLMQVHRMDPKAFLDYVHDIDLACGREHPELSAAIERLPGRKLIFTNGSRRARRARRRQARRAAALRGHLRHRRLRVRAEAGRRLL